MKINKKYILSSVILITAMTVSGLATFGIKGNADEETLTQVKQELQQKDKELENKIDEGTAKDKQIEDLNNKVSSQIDTINQLNASIAQLNQGLENANSNISTNKKDISSAKATEQKDKKEVTDHADSGDANLQKQVDTVKEKQNQPTYTPGNDPLPEPAKDND